jgi:hypothetical protein
MRAPLLLLAAEGVVRSTADESQRGCIKSTLSRRMRGRRRALYFRAQPVVASPLRATGLPLMKTLAAPPAIAPPQAVFAPDVAAGRPLMKTSGDPCTIGPSLAASPWRDADEPPTETSGLPLTMIPGPEGAGL